MNDLGLQPSQGENMWSTAKSLLMEKFTVLNSCIRHEERSQILDLSICFKKLEKQEQVNKISRRKERVSIRVEINEMEDTKTIEKNQSNSKLVH